MKKLHVGCGPSHLREGWINMDIRPFIGIDEVRDASIPFDDLGPLDYIYSEHFLEHLSLDSAVKFLANSFTALAIGGKMRLSTPSLEAVLMSHFDLGQSNQEYIFNATMAINRAFHGWGHQFLWSKTMLDRALTAVGFEDVSFFFPEQSDDPNLRKLELHGKPFAFFKGQPAVWTVEGTKKVAEATIDADFLQSIETTYHRYIRGGH